MIDESKINSIIKNEEMISQIIKLFNYDDEYVKTKVISNNLTKNIKTVLNNYNHTLNTEEIELLINSTHQAIEYAKSNPNQGTVSPIDDNQLLNVSGGELDPQMAILLVQLATNLIPKAYKGVKSLIESSKNPEDTAKSTEINSKT